MLDVLLCIAFACLIALILAGTGLIWVLVIWFWKEISDD